MGVRLLSPTGAQGAQGPPGVGGSPYAIYANWAALPQTGVASGQMATTADTGTAWVWNGTLWRPQVFSQGYSVGLSTATLPSSGATTVGTLSIPSQPFPRLIATYAQMVIGSPSTSASMWELALTATNGGIIKGRCQGGGWSTAVAGVAPMLLSANVAGTITVTATRISATAEQGACANGYSRLDAWLMPY